MKGHYKCPWFVESNPDYQGTLHCDLVLPQPWNIMDFQLSLVKPF